MVNFLTSTSILFLLFSGYFQMLLGIASPLFHIFSLGIIVLNVLSSNNQVKLDIAPLYVLVLLSIYFLLWFSNIDLLSLEYYIKSFIFLIAASLVPSVLNKTTWFWLKRLFLFSLIPALLKFIAGIDWTSTDSNYLTIGLIFGILLIIAILGEKISLSLRVILLLVFTYVSASIGSRGSLIFSLLAVLLFAKQRKYVVTGLSLIAIGVYKAYELGVIEVNSWLRYKMNRLLVQDFEGEPRYEIYSQVLVNLSEPHIFGRGFLPSIFLSTSWDKSLPFLESFPLELIYNFGLFGLAIMIFMFLRIKWISRNNALLGAILFYLLLNYSKSWSVYSGMMLFLAISVSAKVVKEGWS